MLEWNDEMHTVENYQNTDMVFTSETSANVCRHGRAAG